MTTLAQYVQAPALASEFVAECEARATAMVDHRLDGASIPGPIRELAINEVGADLYHRRLSRNGVASFDGGPDAAQPSTVRIARDPMRAADEILRPYLGWGVA